MKIVFKWISFLKPFLQKTWASVLRRCISCRNNWEGSKKRGCSCFQGFQAAVKRLWWRESVKACLFKWRETVPNLLWQGIRHLCVYREFLELFPIFVWRLALPQLQSLGGAVEVTWLDWRWLLGRVHNKLVYHNLCQNGMVVIHKFYYILTNLRDQNRSMYILPFKVFSKEFHSFVH